MGATCSTQAQMPQDISVVIRHVNMQDQGHDHFQIIQQQLSRNNLILRKRIAHYTEELRRINISDPKVKIYISERTRATELLKEVRRIQEVLACMA